MHKESRRVAVSTLGLILLFSGIVPVQAQTRIKFRRGAASSNVSGTLKSFRGRRVYVIRVREGQTLQTKQVGGGSRPITISVRDGNGNDVGDADASCNSRREISPTVAGDYTIEVVECQKSDPWSGRFTFRVTVR